MLDYSMKNTIDIILKAMKVIKNNKKPQKNPTDEHLFINYKSSYTYLILNLL
jgi:hypothetical protein